MARLTTSEFAPTRRSEPQWVSEAEGRPSESAKPLLKRVGGRKPERTVSYHKVRTVKQTGMLCAETRAVRRMWYALRSRYRPGEVYGSRPVIESHLARKCQWRPAIAAQPKAMADHRTKSSVVGTGKRWRARKSATATPVKAIVSSPLHQCPASRETGASRVQMHPLPCGGRIETALCQQSTF